MPPAALVPGSIAAKVTGRRAVLIEQDESYCRMIRRRLENDTPLFDFAEGANNG